MSALDPNGGGALMVPSGVGTVTSTDITDATAVGRAGLTAVDEAAGRTAIGLTTLASLAIGTAGQQARVNAGATSGEWAEPDVVCTVAELASTYAPSAVLRGVIAYTTDAGATYVCRRTAASTYAWALLAAGADAAAVLAQVDAARSTSWDFASGAGVTLVNGNGTAAVTGGQVTFTTPASVSTAAPNAPSATVSIPAGVDPWRGMDVSVRLVTLATAGGGLPTGVVAWLSLGNKTDGKNGTYSGSDMGVLLTVQPDGAVNAADYTPSINTRGSSAAGVVQRDGQDWVRLVFRDDVYGVFAGRGVTRPTVWTRLYSGTLGAAATSTAAHAQPTTITLAGYRNSGAPAEDIVVTFDDLLVTGLL